MEFVFRNIYLKAGFSELPKYFKNISFIFFQYLIINKNIVQINLYELAEKVE